MKMMTVKDLKRLLELCDDSSNVKILCCDWHDIKSVSIEYIIEDEYQIPCVILKTSYEE